MSRSLLAAFVIVALLHLFCAVYAQHDDERSRSSSRRLRFDKPLYKPPSTNQTTPGHSSSTQPKHGWAAPPGFANRKDPFDFASPNNIAVCAIMKDERAEDVKEFIDYHRWVGVDTFYFRENGEECAIQSNLQPYIDAGILDLGLIPGPKHPSQTNWFNECSRLATRQHKWVAFLDLDEFMIVLNTKQKAITQKDALKRMLLKSHFRYASSISMQWVLFGSSGHKDMPPEGQLKGFVQCTGVLSKQMKCLGSTYWLHHIATFRPTHVHQCNFRQGAVSVLGNADPLRMNRYKIAGGAHPTYSVSHRAHLEPNMHKRYTEITPAYNLVLFHYVTRAQNAFVDRKINLRSGVYATTYKELRTKDPSANPDTLYKRFEHEYGFDGTHNICRQGGPVSDAMNAARQQGWNPVPDKPGVLGQR